MRQQDVGDWKANPLSPRKNINKTIMKRNKKLKRSAKLEIIKNILEKLKLENYEIDYKENIFIKLKLKNKIPFDLDIIYPLNDNANDNKNRLSIGDAIFDEKLLIKTNDDLRTLSLLTNELRKRIPVNVKIILK